MDDLYVVYNGEEYFADTVFGLSDEQKALADNYAQNLSLFLGDGTIQSLLPSEFSATISLGDIRFVDGQTPVVYFNQLDDRYANKPYGTDNIGGYGCGPTAMSIVVSSLTDDTVDPEEMAKWSYDNGYWCSKSGSYHALIPAAAEAWGLPVEGCSASEGQKIVDALSSGKLIVAIMSKGHFTSSGHFIVLRGVKDGKILVADPASYTRSEKEWDLSIICSEASKYAGAGGPFWINRLTLWREVFHEQANEHDINEHDTYIIPPNFIESGTFFGGLLKARNAVEAGILILVVGIPVFSLSLPFTTCIIILCLTALPLGLLALIGISGESLSAFIFAFFKYLKNRRVVGKLEESASPQANARRRVPKAKKELKERRHKKEDFPAEFDEVPEQRKPRIRIHRKERQQRSQRPEKQKKPAVPPPKFLNPVAEYLPIEKIANGIIYTKDRRYLKIIEVIPINFLLRSAREQRNIIYSFISYLKICPVKMQFKVITKRADLTRHKEILMKEMEQETDDGCRLLQKDYLELIDQIGSREATTRRFFIIFEHEACPDARSSNEEAEAISSLQTAARTAANYLKQCGNGSSRRKRGRVLL
jgi:predicted double-glycine peptidase